MKKILKIIFKMIFIFIAVPCLFSAPVGWNDTTTIIEKDASQPALIPVHNNLYAVYQKNIQNETGIFFIRSTNEGRSWFDEKKNYCRFPIDSRAPDIFSYNITIVFV